MKKHQATIRNIPAVGSQAIHSQEIEPLQPQLNREQLAQRSEFSWQLAASAERINQLSAELEAALFELKEIASDIKQQQNPPKIANRVLDYQAIAIPYIQRKRTGLFVLKAKAVDLFAEEKAAFALAQQLRRRTKIRSKRSKNRMSLANISWRLGKFLQKLLRQWLNAIAPEQVNNQAQKIDLPLATKTTKMESSRKRFVLQR